ncbi:MAG: hypothetical protein HY651_00550 [Acidobacteria bacterium]|nr:hypothetical protein [Acidobacteriota bacterium]
MQLLADPQIARSIRNPLVGTVFPFVAGACTNVTASTNSQDKIPKWSATDCQLTDSAITDISGKIGIGTTSGPATALDVAGTIRAILSSTAPYGSYLIPTAGSANGFRFGLGNNVYFDGTNWKMKYDGANNGGAAILTDIGQGDLEFFAVAPSGTTDQSLSNATFNTKERMRLTAAGFLGIGTTSPAEKLDVIGNIKSDGLNQIIFLRPNGSTDGDQINDAITNKLPSNGGIIYLTPGEYHINTKIIIAKNGVKLRGFGACDPGLGASDNPLTKLLWKGSSYGTVVELKPSSSTAQIQDLELSDLSIDGWTGSQNDNKASIGLLLDRVLNSKFLNVRVRNCLGTNGTGIKMTTTSDGVDDLGTSWNHFENCSIWDCTTGLHLTSETSGGAVANCCHNTFVALNIQGGSCVTGIKLEVCDNNCFYRVMTPGDATTGVLIADPDKAATNYFYHLQAGGTYGLKVENANGAPYSRNLVFGYSRDNGEQEPLAYDGESPVTPISDYVYWVDSFGDLFARNVYAQNL